MLAQVTLGRDVVVLGRSAHEFPLFETISGILLSLFHSMLKRSLVLPCKEAHLVETGGEARLLRGGEDESVVQSAEHLVRHSLERPRPIAHII